MFDSVIRESIRYAESDAHAMPVTAYEPHGNAADDFRAFAAEFAGRLGRPLSGGKEAVNDPLSAILGGAAGSKSPPPPGRGRPQAVTPEPEAAEVVLLEVRVGFDLTIDLSEAIRDCVVFLQGPPHHLNMSRFAEEACRREIERLRQEANGGEAFPKRQQAPRDRPSSGMTPQGGCRGR